MCVQVNSLMNVSRNSVWISLEQQFICLNSYWIKNHCFRTRLKNNICWSHMFCPPCRIWTTGGEILNRNDGGLEEVSDGWSRKAEKQMEFAKEYKWFWFLQKRQEHKWWSNNVFDSSRLICTNKENSLTLAGSRPHHELALRQTLRGDGAEHPGFMAALLG